MPGEKYVISPDSNVNLLKKHGEISGLSLIRLKDFLGEPSSGWCDKVQYEWIFVGPNGTVVTLYDWNDSQKHNTWHVGSLKPAQAQDFIKWLTKKIPKIS